jgi:hypothetical protein
MLKTVAIVVCFFVGGGTEFFLSEIVTAHYHNSTALSKEKIW